MVGTKTEEAFMKAQGMFDISRRTLQLSNGTECISPEVDKISEGYALFNLILLMLSLLCMIIAVLGWIKYRNETYLKRRNVGLIALMCLGWIANMICGPLYKLTLDSKYEALRPSCFLVNCMFILVIPFLVIPQLVRLTLFRNRVLFNKKVAELLSDNFLHNSQDIGGSSMFSNSNFTMKSLKFRASSKYGLMLAGISMSSVFVIAIFYAFGNCPSRLFPDQECTFVGLGSYKIVMFLLPILLCTIALVRISFRTFGEPDPFDILREIKISYLGFFLGAPGLVLSLFDPGNIETQVPFRWTWSSLVDIGILAYFIWSTNIQVYKAYKKKNFTVEANGVDLEKVLNSETGSVLFEQHLLNEFSVENLTCWQRIQKWKKEYDTLSEEVIGKEAQAINAKWIQEGAVLEVNVSYSAKKDFNSMISGKNISKDSFLEIESELYSLMASDSFPRFVKSDLFKQYIGEADLTLNNIADIVHEDNL